MTPRDSRRQSTIGERCELDRRTASPSAAQALEPPQEQIMSARINWYYFRKG